MIPDLIWNVNQTPAGRSCDSSVGERQMICIARALLKKSNILIIDEATSQIDWWSESLMKKAINKHFKQCTILTVDHRLKNVLDSDRVLVLSNGKVDEFDTPKKLLENHDGVFYSLAVEAGIIVADLQLEHSKRVNQEQPQNSTSAEQSNSTSGDKSELNMTDENGTDLDDEEISEDEIFQWLTEHSFPFKNETTSSVTEKNIAGIEVIDTVLKELDGQVNILPNEIASSTTKQELPKVEMDYESVPELNKHEFYNTSNIESSNITKQENSEVETASNVIVPGLKKQENMEDKQESDEIAEHSTTGGTSGVDAVVSSISEIVPDVDEENKQLT